jgi:myo-inositol-1(or 4)-monophosphatase
LAYRPSSRPAEQSTGRAVDRLTLQERCTLTTAWADELDFATNLARRAGHLLTDSYERLERIDYKSKRDVVTNADYASEHLVINAIRERYPDDAILAEESGEHAGMLRDDGSGNGRTWVIDPLDGTVNYANGIPFYCVSIGLVVDDRPTVGVVLDPAREDLYAATADGPATLDGKPVRASTKETLQDYVVSLAVIGRGGLSRERRIAPRIRIHRRMGSAALALAYVANGRFDAFVQNGGLSPWDVAAAGLIAERAGALVTDLRGGPWWNPKVGPPRINLVAAPEVQHGPILELLSSLRTTVQTRR